MSSVVPILLLTALAACRPPWHDTSDSEPDTGGDSAPDDTGEDLQAIRFVITDPSEGTTLGLYTVTVEDSGTLRFGPALTTAKVASSQATLRVATPEPGALTDWDPDAYPGLQAAWYTPAVHVDDDDDGVKDTAELVVGAGPALVTYLSGPLGDLAEQGFEEGWNAFVLGSKDERIVTPLTSVPAAADLWPASATTAIDIGGTWEGVRAPDDLGVAVVPDLWSTGEAPLYDTATGFEDEAWDVALEEEPPFTHRAWHDAYAAEAAIEYPVAYDDLDHDGTLTQSDTVVGGTCYDVDTEGYKPAFLVYLPRTASLDLAWLLERLDLDLGWLVETEIGGARTFLNASGARGLRMTESCVPDLSGP
ncbi:MAG: hypothetical protein JXB39_16400 [Deltaproteobacteria bacterium]|nr:hypothetical protein [Deltaproteobacteria bacterium]